MLLLARVTPTQVYKGPVTCNRAKLRQQEVHAFLSKLHHNIDENNILLSHVLYVDAP